MPNLSEISKRTTAIHVMQGLSEPDALDGRTVPYDGRRLTKTQLFATFRDHLKALDRVSAARAALQAALLAERRAAVRAHGVEQNLRAWVLANYGKSHTMLAAFGWRAPKKRGPKTIAGKAEGVRKRAAVRAAKKAALAKLKK